MSSNAKYFNRQSPFALLGHLILKARTTNAENLFLMKKQYKHRYWLIIIPNHEPMKLKKKITANFTIVLVQHFLRTYIQSQMRTCSKPLVK